MDRSELIQNLKAQIIEQLNLMDMTPADIADDAQLFGEEIGLDSIDSFELIVLMEREYGVKITDPKEGRQILATVEAMADYILEKSDKFKA
ncbi:phosphopantetheine-binding protein [Wandonia haliotis]|uniref:Phosphopantetheine-binding protein n=1 Tax=Wandonia haliotis TaxID=574963 RepID=A0ABN1MSS2_9FLAO